MGLLQDLHGRKLTGCRGCDFFRKGLYKGLDLWKPDDRIQAASTHDSFNASSLGAYTESALKGRGAEEKQQEICGGGFIAIRSHEAGGQWLIEIANQGNFPSMANPGQLDVWTFRVLPEDQVGGSFDLGFDAATTFSACDGGLSVDTPGGFRETTASVSTAAFRTANGPIQKLEQRESTEFEPWARWIPQTPCATDSITDWYANAESVVPGLMTALGSQNFNVDLSLCGGGTHAKPHSLTEFRYIEPNARSVFDRDSITELAGQATIEAWENQGSRPVLDFVGIPQADTGDVRNACWTPGSGGWYRHGPDLGASNLYEWHFVTAGFGPTQPWTTHESVIVRPGETWPVCVDP